MSIPLRLGPANYWIRDKVLFSAWSRCALKTCHGETKKTKNGGIKDQHLNFGFRNQSSEKPLSGQGDFHMRPDLSHLRGFFFFFPYSRKGAEQQDASRPTVRRSKGWMERMRTTERGRDRIESPGSQTANINPSERKRSKG